MPILFFDFPFFRFQGLLLFLVLVLHPFRSDATGFEITFGGPGTQICTGMAIGADSSIYLLGYNYSGPLGGVDFMLSKATLAGTVLWTKFLGTPHDDFGASVLLMPSGNLLLAGTTHDVILSEQVLLIETDTAGNEIGQSTFGTQGIESVFAATNCIDNGYLITGYQTNSGSNYSYMLKVDSLLNEEWTGAYGIGINDYASEGIMRDDNAFYLSSDRRFNTGGGNFDYDVSVLMADSTGAVLWDSVYHEDFQNGCQGIIRSLGGHLLTFGETEIFQFSPFDYFIFATDSNGNLLWRQTFGGPGTNALFDLIEDPSGNLIGTGYGNSLSNGVDPINVTILKTDPLGNLLWEREYGFNSIDIGYIIRPSPDGGYLVAGRATTADDEDFYLLKVNSDGLITDQPEISSESGKLVLYPNPASDQFRFRAPTGIDGVNISDMTGKIVASQHLNAPEGALCTVLLPVLPPGVFLVELRSKGGFSGRTLLVIR
jgi:hypothetical protein